MTRWREIRGGSEFDEAEVLETISCAQNDYSNSLQFLIKGRLLYITQFRSSRLVNTLSSFSRSMLYSKPILYYILTTNFSMSSYELTIHPIAKAHRFLV